MAKGQPYRKTLAIPRKDESVLAWWESQEEPVWSVLRLIHDQIERDGVDHDVIFYAKDRQPRRGRPPKQESPDDHREPVQDEQHQAVDERSAENSAAHDEDIEDEAAAADQYLQQNI